MTTRTIPPTDLAAIIAAARAVVLRGDNPDNDRDLDLLDNLAPADVVLAMAELLLARSTGPRLSSGDIAALVAVRSVIADAQHPGREAAIAALDRLAAPADRCRLRVDGKHIWCPVQPGFVTDLGGYAELVRRGIGECCKLCGAARPGSVPAPKLIDFVEAAWLTLHPDQCFERTPVVEAICERLDRLGGDPHLAAETRVGFEWGNRVMRRDPEGDARLSTFAQMVPVTCRREGETWPTGAGFDRASGPPPGEVSSPKASPFVGAPVNRFVPGDREIRGTPVTVRREGDMPWRVAQPLGPDLLAGVARLYGLDRLTLDYDESVSVWCVRGTRRGRVDQKQVIDRDLREASSPIVPWFKAIRELVFGLDVSDVQRDKDAQLHDLLTRGA